jgi:hypothetical protein
MVKCLVWCTVYDRKNNTDQSRIIGKSENHQSW